MMVTELVDAILEEVKHWASENAQPVGVLATWEAAEGVDADLSEISFPDGSVVNGVPKIEQVTGLSNGDTVLCLNVENRLPLVIVGKVVGDISLFGG